jgi:hypothetical protein
MSFTASPKVITVPGSPYHGQPAAPQGAPRNLDPLTGSFYSAANNGGQAKQLAAANATYTKANIQSCGTCPDSVVNLLVDETNQVLGIVRRVKRYTDTLNRLLHAVEDGVMAIINALIDLIPWPPVFDISEYLRTVTCPLTPQAYTVSVYQKHIVQAQRNVGRSTPYGSLNPAYYPALWSNFSAGFTKEWSELFLRLDPRKQWQKFADMWARMAKEWWRRVVEFLDTESPSDVYPGEMLRVAHSPPTKEDVPNPQEGMVVYYQMDGSSVGGTRNSARAGGATKGTLAPGSTFEQPTDARPLAFTTRRRFAYRNGTWVPLGDSQTKKTIKTLFRIINDVWSTMRDIGYFGIRLSVTKASVALIRATCPNLYFSAAYPFQKFDEETRGWGVSGFLPSGVKGDIAQKLTAAMMKLVAKLQSWVTASYVVLV